MEEQPRGLSESELGLDGRAPAETVGKRAQSAATPEPSLRPKQVREALNAVVESACAGLVDWAALNCTVPRRR